MPEQAVKQSHDIDALMMTIGAQAKAASRPLSIAGTDQKNRALLAMASAIEASRETILAANRKDLAAADNSGLAASFIDRLTLDDARIAGIAEGIRSVAALPDPVGEVIAAWDRPNGLKIERVRTPLGVIGVIYESRPNVTADAGALCLKAGNAVILRGGSDLATFIACYPCLPRRGPEDRRSSRACHSTGAGHRSRSRGRFAGRIEWRG